MGLSYSNYRNQKQRENLERNRLVGEGAGNYLICGGKKIRITMTSHQKSGKQENNKAKYLKY